MDGKSETILVPVVEVGCGTRTAVIRGGPRGGRRCVEGVETLTLVAGVLHLEMPVVERMAGLVRVELPDGSRLWVTDPGARHGNAA